MSDQSEQETYHFECDNCLSPTNEHGPCVVCGAEPHEGEGYRIECEQCGSVAFGDRGSSVQHDMTMHRMRHCSKAVFKVEVL